MSLTVPVPPAHPAPSSETQADAQPATAPSTFSDPPREAAAAFRAALDAMARPGQPQVLAGAAPSSGLSQAAAVLLLTLADADTPVWLPDRLAQGAAADWLRFHTNAPRAADCATAVFAVGTWEDLGPLSRWPVGEAAYPDRSATLVLELPALDGGTPRRLSGPGIRGSVPFAAPLPEPALADLAANAARYPLGVDLFLTAGDRAIGLPRTTRIGG